MRVRHLECASAIPAAQWDALFPPGYPFTRHAFLAALEAHGCVGPELGWTPCHAVLSDDRGIAAIAPLYLKAHSYGEFVFDFAWADASRRLGQPYYPKLVNAIPFTPCIGPRIGARDPSSRLAMAQQLPALAATAGLSGAHALFLDDADFVACRAAGMVERNDVQFHWYNASYSDFASFLATFSSDKRKKILRERRRMAEAGIRFEHRAGHELDEAAWRQVYRLYANTYAERGQRPYLTDEFFLDYGRQADTAVRLVLAFERTEMVAVAILLRGGDTLYGRHWGAADRYNGLHFETCYYQGIDYCIREGLRHFDAGAQGEHKLARGFTPQITRSAHWLAEPRLFDAVADHLERERAYVSEREALLDAHSPYKRVATAAAPEA
ncbi:MAG: GNAT family N-acetyltransferase [Xanthomonadaceae bacterium]|nr:GNAT family N-acetyltransferase [Xanthomonadaceae bacterium]